MALKYLVGKRELALQVAEESAAAGAAPGAAAAIGAASISKKGGIRKSIVTIEDGVAGIGRFDPMSRAVQQADR